MIARHRYRRTPVVPQMEEQDCGAACLASILGSFGRSAPLSEVSEACGISRDGASPGAVARAGGRYGLVAAARRIRRDDGSRTLGLEAAPVPALVQLGAHFVVLEGLRGSWVRVNDPLLGRYAATPEEFWEDFKGVAVGFTPGPEFRPGGQRWAFARSLSARVGPYLPALLVAAGAAVLLAAPGMLGALLLQHVYISDVLYGGNWSWAWPLALGTAGAGLITLLGTWLQYLITGRVVQAMAARGSGRFLWKLLRLPGAFFHRRALGGLVVRVQLNDALANLIAARGAAALASVATSVVYLAALIWLDPLLSPVPAGIAVCNVLALRMVARRQGARQHALQTAQARRDAIAFAGVAAIETLKAEGSEDVFFRSWAGWQARTISLNQSLASATQNLLAVPAVLSLAANGVVIVLAMHQIIAGTVPFWTVAAFLMLMSAFLLPVSSMVGLGADLVSARAQSALLEDVERAEPDPYLRPVLSPGPDTEPLTGHLALHEITFGYQRFAPPLLDAVSLRVEPGQWLAIVGHTGSGKSTLARLAAGVLRPWSGEVRLDGRPRDEVDRMTVSTSVGYVEQHLRLFDGTVRDNLTLWGPVPDDQLWAALRDAEADDLVRGRGGLDAQIEEDARNLSGGERQRLELARALATDPTILILDEATSALDADTETRIVANLRRRGCSCLLLAHRLSTVRGADRVLVLDGGRIVEEGRHDDLVAAAGRYHRLVEDLA
jgi:ABC-type bacteriocin/lantibiotic exporter with double-glycine peptidase domain